MRLGTARSVHYAPPPSPVVLIGLVLISSLSVHVVWLVVFFSFCFLSFSFLKSFRSELTGWFLKALKISACQL